MKANYRHYTLFVLAFLAFVATGLGYSYVRSQIFTQAVKAAELAKQVDVLEQKKKHEYDATTTYSRRPDQPALLTKYLISKEKVVDFIELIENIGTETSTEIDLTGIDSPEITKTAAVEANYSHMKAHIQIDGTWPNVLRAIALLEKIPYSVGYDNVSVSQEGEGDSSELSSKPATTTPATKRPTKKWHVTMDVKSLIIP
jgi:hypothetical protein